MPTNSELKRYRPPKEVRPEHKEFLERIGKKLKELREQNEISINQFAKKVKLSRNAYTQLENGIVYINMLSLLKVLDFYDIPASRFFKKL